MSSYSPRHSPQRDHTAYKIIAVAFLFGLAWTGLWARAFQVQVLMGDELAARAKRQHQASEYVSGERGEIFDRRGRVLAKSVTCRSVYARPMDVTNPAQAAVALAGVLGLSRSRLEQKLTSRKPFVWLARETADSQAAQVESLDLPGVHLATEYRRLYPNGPLAGQLLGFAGVDGEGLEGLEKAFDGQLAGTRNKHAVQRDARGTRLALGGGPKAGLSRGQDVQLTIDADIQSIAEHALEKAVTRYKGKWGASLVVEVASGEILAWAQYPFFNPNIYRRYEPSAWRNRLAMDALEPGSTMKPLVVAAALQEKVVTPDTVYDCEDGKWKMRGATINDTHEYGELPVRKIVRYSSNIGTAKIGLELGAKRLHGYLDKLGFGRKAGLPLAGESRGILRDAGTWYDVDLATISFGQGVAVTGVQMVGAYLNLARGGVSAPLKIVQGLDESPRDRKVFDKTVADDVLVMLRDSVEEDGTGPQARIPGMEVGGKTGTAQKADPAGGYGDKFSASFVGLIPARDPEFLIMVVVDEPGPQHYGGVVAAPVVKEVATRTLAYLGRLPDTAVAQAPQDETQGEGQYETTRSTALELHSASYGSASALEATKTVPNVVGMSVRRAVELFAGGGAVPELRGDGTVVGRQSPAPGRPWSKKQSPAVLWLSSDPGWS